MKKQRHLQTKSVKQSKSVKVLYIYELWISKVIKCLDSDKMTHFVITIRNKLAEIKQERCG